VVWINWIHLVQDRDLQGFFEQGNKPPGSMKFEEVLVFMKLVRFPVRTIFHFISPRIIIMRRDSIVATGWMTEV
jgi:hypothetical protein